MIERELPKKRAATLRVLDFAEFEGMHGTRALGAQAGRCMDCGVAFCHGGCPIGNLIPEWNELVRKGEIAAAAERLGRTNNFPEFTGRICPAPCEAACVLNLRGEPVTIKQIEKQIAEHAPLHPQVARYKTDKRIAIVGSGPAGLAAAQQLARAGHAVTVYERADKPGGLLRYGIPDFKLEKWRVDRRIEQLAAEGVAFRCGVSVGADISLAELRDKNDAVLLATGATRARDLPIGGRELSGVRLAMDYLEHANRAVAGALLDPALSAAGKNVVIIGGGDTGADCVGTAHRQGARSVTQLEVRPRPPEAQAEAWPNWPMIFRTSPAHEEGGTRDFAVRTLRFNGDQQVRALVYERLDAPQSEFALDADLVLLALGYEGVDHPADFSLNGVAASTLYASADSYATEVGGVFACGDARRGASLVVWAIAEGRAVAELIDAHVGQHSRRAG